MIWVMGGRGMLRALRFWRREVVEGPVSKRVVWGGVPDISVSC